MIPIFISHSSHDGQSAADLKSRLTTRGYNGVFLDFDREDGIGAGKDWENEIYRKMRRSNAVIVLCSEDSMTSQWVFAEIVLALSTGKKVFPVKVAPCDIVAPLQDTQIVDVTVDPEDGYERLFDGLRAEGIDPNNASVWRKDRIPYPGLAAFQAEDAAVFFGRDDAIREATDLLNRLRRFGDSRLITVLGGSGSGKSSLIRAGIVHRLNRDPKQWVVVNPFRPGNNPIAEMARALTATFLDHGIERDWKTIQGQWSSLAGGEDPDRQLTASMASLQGDLLLAAGAAEASLVLIVDQFEEAFGSPDNASAFSSLVRAWLFAGSHTAVLAALRSDFLVAFEKNSVLASLPREQLLVPFLKREDFAEAIEGPARQAEIELGQGLVQALIEDAETDDALPLLAYTLRQLWERFAGDHLITLEEYRHLLGGLNGAISKNAEEVLAAHAGYDDRALKRAFLKMVRVNAEGAYVKQIVLRDDLPAEVHLVIQDFVNARLLVADRDEAGRPTIETAHEALFRTWRKLADWLSENRSFLAWRRRLTTAIEEWEGASKDAEAYLRGVLLAEAMKWSEERQDDLTTAERAFIRNSFENEQRERVRKDRLRRRGIWALEGGLIVASILGGIAWLQYRNQKAEASVSLSRQLAAVSRNQLESHPALSLLLAVEANHVAPSVEARSNLLELLQATSHVVRVLHDDTTPGLPVFFIDDNTVVTASLIRGPNDMLSGLRVWPLGETNARQDVLVFSDYGETAFSPDGQTFATIMDGKQILTGETADLQQRFKPGSTSSSWPGQILAHSGDKEASITAIAFAPDGRTLVSGSGDGALKFWDISSRRLTNSATTNGEISALAFSSDGKTLATATRNGQITFREVISGKESRPPFRVTTGPIDRIALSGNGLLLAVVAEGVVKLWDAGAGRLIRELDVKDEDEPLSVALDTRGTLLGFCGKSGISLWTVPDGKLIGKRVKFRDDALTSPDGRLILKYDEHTLEIRQASNDAVLHEIEYDSSTANFSTDGKSVVAVGSNGEIKRWASGDGHALPDLPFHIFANKYLFSLTDDNSKGVTEVLSGAAASVLVSRDGRYLVSGTYAGATIIWDLQERSLIERHFDAKTVSGLAFSPERNMLFAANNDKNVHEVFIRGWTLDDKDTQPSEHRQPREDSVADLRLGVDGVLHVLTNLKDFLTVRQAETWKVLGPLVKAEHLEAARLSAIGNTEVLLVAQSDDRSIKILNSFSGNPLRAPIPIPANIHKVGSMDVSPDGSLIAIANADDSTDDSVTLVDFKSGRVLKPSLSAHTHDVWSVAFTPDSAVLASGSNDASVILWDVATHRQIGVLQPNIGLVDHLAFTPNGGRLVASGAKGTVEWNLASWEKQACAIANRTLTTEEWRQFLGSRPYRAACPRLH